MPAGFYWDGILFIILGVLGLIGSLFTQLSLVPAWRQSQSNARQRSRQRRSRSGID